MLLRELTETVYGNQLVLCDEEGVCDCFERSMILTNDSFRDNPEPERKGMLCL